MQIEGHIKLIGETKEYGNNGFKKREMVLTTNEQYPQHILIEFVKDKCAVLDNYLEGEEVKVSINLKGREWVNSKGETKYFNSIQAWKIERVFNVQQQNANTQAPPPEPNNLQDDYDDDLPI